MNKHTKNYNVLSFNLIFIKSGFIQGENNYLKKYVTSKIKKINIKIYQAIKLWINVLIL